MKTETFLLNTEADKILNIVTTDKAAYRTRMSNSDLAALPFKSNDSGFFVAFIRKEGNGIAATRLSATDALKHYMVVDTGKYVRLSAYCTFDRVRKHLRQVEELFDAAVIGYSTPTHLQILAENPAIL